MCRTASGLRSSAGQNNYPPRYETREQIVIYPSDWTHEQRWVETTRTRLDPEGDTYRRQILGSNRDLMIIRPVKSFRSWSGFLTQL